MSSKSPSDLISLSAAATMAGKSSHTIRSWIKKKKVSGYKEDPDNRNSALLVSEEELRVYLGLNGKVTSPEVGRKEDLSVSLLAKDAEISILKNKVESLERENAQLLANISQFQQLSTNLNTVLESRGNELDKSNERVRELILLISEYQQENQAISTKYQQLTTYLSLPWWKRMSSTLLLENKKEA